MISRRVPGLGIRRHFLPSGPWWHQSMMHFLSLRGYFPSLLIAELFTMFIAWGACVCVRDDWVGGTMSPVGQIPV